MNPTLMLRRAGHRCDACGEVIDSPTGVPFILALDLDMDATGPRATRFTHVWCPFGQSGATMGNLVSLGIGFVPAMV